MVPSSFSFDLVQVTEQQVELRWSDLSPLTSVNYKPIEIFLQYHEEANSEWDQGEEDRSRNSEDKKGTRGQGSIKKHVKVPISISSRGVTVAGLYPGSIYSFTLKASHPAGASWSLGQTQTAYTSESAESQPQRLCYTKKAGFSMLCSQRSFLKCLCSYFTGPLSPQNITIGPITVSQILVHWLQPKAHYMDGWTFVVRYLDMSSRREGIVGMTNISRSSEPGGLQSHTAVIGGLEPYRKYMVEVYTVTQHGIESCAPVPLTAQTGKHEGGFHILM